MPFPAAAVIGAGTSLAAPIIGKAGAKAPPKSPAPMPMPSNAGAMGSNTASTSVSFSKPAPVTASSYATEKLKSAAPGGSYG